MSGPVSPFWSSGGGNGIAGSRSAGWTFTKTAQTSTAEVLASFSVSDDASGRFSLLNSTSTDGRFEPMLAGVSPDVNSRPALSIRGGVPSARDNGTSPIVIFSVRNEAASAITARTMFSWQNNGTSLLDLIPLNSGANSALSWGNQTTGAPTFTTRSAGTRLVLRNELSGSRVDNAIGANGVGPWYSAPEATSAWSHRWYGGTTQIADLRGDGQYTSTGSKVDKLRVALTTPVTVVAGTDYIIVTNLTTPGAVAVNLPATPTAGLTYVIKDGKGDAAANNITITPAAGTIDGAATLVIAANYGRAVLTYNGTEWNVTT